MADQEQPQCPQCGMAFTDVDEVGLEHRQEHHGWVTGPPEPHYQACKEASPEEREAYKEAKRIVQQRNADAVQARADRHRKIRAQGFEDKGKDQLGM
jgi:uncharacterized C2H2 Zn-finger protein